MSCQNDIKKVCSLHSALGIESERKKENQRNWINCVFGSNLVLQRATKYWRTYRVRDKTAKKLDSSSGPIKCNNTNARTRCLRLRSHRTNAHILKLAQFKNKKKQTKNCGVQYFDVERVSISTLTAVHAWSVMEMGFISVSLFSFTNIDVLHTERGKRKSSSDQMVWWRQSAHWVWCVHFNESHHHSGQQSKWAHSRTAIKSASNWFN